jgi:hypothetical protein
MMMSRNDYLLKTGKELMDIIALRCEFPIYKISGMLLNMELKGVIRPCLENYLRLFNFNMLVIKALYK